jgi:hypothetical protein
VVSQGFSERLHFRKGCFALVIATAAFDNTGIFHAEEPNNLFVLRFVRAAIK